ALVPSAVAVQQALRGRRASPTRATTASRHASRSADRRRHHGGTNPSSRSVSRARASRGPLTSAESARKEEKKAKERERQKLKRQRQAARRREKRQQDERALALVAAPVAADNPEAPQSDADAASARHRALRAERRLLRNQRKRQA